MRCLIAYNWEISLDCLENTQFAREENAQKRKPRGRLEKGRCSSLTILKGDLKACNVITCCSIEICLGLLLIVIIFVLR